MADGEQQFHAFGLAMVACAPLRNRVVDDIAQRPLGAQRAVPLIDHQDALVAEIQHHERRFIGVGLVLAQDGRMRVVPVDLHRWISVVHRGRGAADPLGGQGAFCGQMTLEVDDPCAAARGSCGERSGYGMPVRCRRLRVAREGRDRGGNRKRHKPAAIECSCAQRGIPLCVTETGW